MCELGCAQTDRGCHRHCSFLSPALVWFFTLVPSGQWSHSADCWEWPSFMSESKVRGSSYLLPSRDWVRLVNFDIP